MTKKLTASVMSLLVGFLLVGSLLSGSPQVEGRDADPARNMETTKAAVRARQQTAAPVATVPSAGGSRFTFAWSAAGVPATIPLPLPPEVQVEDVEGVVLPDTVSVLGFALEADTRELVLSLSPAPGREEVSFDEIQLLLVHGVSQPHRVGAVRLVSAVAGSADLGFEQSVSAAGAGLHLGVALHNRGEHDLLVRGVEYLPQGSSAEQRLLVATSREADTLLAAAERSLTPSRPKLGESAPAAEARSDPPVPVAGFRWLHPEQTVLVPAGQRLVLVWSKESLPEVTESASFLLHPVIVFTRIAQPARLQRLGLPVALRSRH